MHACTAEVYGSPTAFLSDGERDEAMVFGSDRFEQLAHHFWARPGAREAVTVSGSYDVL
mgnify:CR=1 FL=1